MLVSFKDWFHLHYLVLKDFAGPLVAVAGILVTALIAAVGFQSFGKWKRQKIEERRIDIALEALSIAYEAQYIFDGIRNPGSFAYEYSDAKKGEGESDDDFDHRKTFYVTLKRIDDNKDFFLRVLKCNRGSWLYSAPKPTRFSNNFTLLASISRSPLRC